MKAFIRVTLWTLAIFTAVSCAPAGDLPEYPDTQSQSAHNGPWAATLAPLEAAYDRRDDDEVNRLLAVLSPQLRSQYGEQSVPFAEVTTYAALQLYREHRDEASLTYFRDALQHYRAALGFHPDVAIAMHTYADALLSARGKNGMAEAEPLYREAYALRVALLGASNIQTIGVAEQLFDAIEMHAENDDDRRKADEFMTNALASAASESMDELSRRRLTEAMIHFADALAERGELEEATLQYLHARAQLFTLPRSSWELAHSIYPSLINCLNDRHLKGQAIPLETEYLALRISQGF